VIKADLKSLFLLNEEITFLNFGSFGACPKPIFEKYQAYQLEMEHDPVQFITVRLAHYLQKNREALAKYISCDADDIVMVPNPSYAVNTIAKSIAWKQDDEILTTDLEYGACDKTWKFVTDSVGAKYIRQHISLPIIDEASFVTDFFAGVSHRTKLIFLSHITSTTALILPVAAIAARAKQLGIPVFIDGAHAPGHIPLDIKALDVAYYTGACHKWMMTPKGSSFMYIKKECQNDIKPLIVSWGYEALFPSHSTFLDWHSMNGTKDYTASICVGDAIDFMVAHEWNDIGSRSRDLVKAYAGDFAKALNSELLAPLTDDFIGQMVSVEIKTDDPEKLYRIFVDGYKIEIPVMRHGNKVYLRYSIQGFNDSKDLDKLIDTIYDLKKRHLLE
jgi:isopenicillin-N epimerase